MCYNCFIGAVLCPVSYERKTDMNIAVVDDLPEERERVRRFLSDYCLQSGRAIDVSLFENAEEFLRDYKPYKYSLIFMDIYMGATDGIEAAQYVRERDSDTIIIFLTTSRDHMPEAFSVHAYDYLAKPVDDERMKKLMDGIMEKHSMSQRELIIVCEGRERTVKYSDIISVCSESHRVEVADKIGNVYVTYRKFTDIADELENEGHFLKINRGIIVNMDNVSDISRGICKMTDGSSLPVSIRGKKQVEQQYANYMFSKIRSDTMRRSGI